MFTISKPGHISRAGQGEGRGAGAREPLYQPWTLLSTLLGLARCKSTHIYTYLPISTRQRGAVLCGLRAGHGGGGVAGEGARAGGARRLGQLHRRPHPPPAPHSQHLQHRLAPRGPHRCPSQCSTVQYSTVQYSTVQCSTLYRVSSKTVYTWLFALLWASTHANCKSSDIFEKFRKFAT